MSSPNSPRDYWQEPARSRRHSAQPAGSGEDGYAPDGGYRRGGGDGRRAAGGYGRTGDYGRAGGSGYGHGNGYGRGDGNEGYPRGGRGGYGRSDDGYRAPESYRPREGHRFSNFGGATGDDDVPQQSGYSGRASRSRSSELGSDLRSRLGLGNGRGSHDGYSGDGYSGDGYGDASGYSRGYDSGTSRWATGLRERATSRFGGAGTREGQRARGYAGGGSGGGRDGRVRVKRKGDWWRHWTWKKALFVALGTGGGMVVLMMLGVLYAYLRTAVPTDVSQIALQQSSTVYFSNGKTEVGTFTAKGVYRQLLNSNQIPQVMKNAMVAAEDRHFYTEGGISPTGILRAAYTDLRGGDYAQGGSTITQQFVRNYYASIGTEQTLSRKIKEIFVAIKLSHLKSKDWILTQYLNIVPFGENAYGVEAAAETYFGEPAMKLTVSQAAMLAALPNEPSSFSPDPSAGAGYRELVKRWHYVLTNMVRDNVLTQAQANAQKFPKVIPNNDIVAAGYTGYKGYIMQAVENELENTYGYSQQEIDGGGLKIVTTFNVNLMNKLYTAVGDNLQQMQRDGTALPWYGHIGALLEQPGSGAILAMYGGPGLDLSPSQCEKLLCDDNTATEDREQVGSSFKPYVLATAVHEGMDVQDSILDGTEPMCVPPDSEPTALSTVTTNCPPPGFEVNIPGEGTGPLSVPEATAISSDPAYEDLIHHAGTQATINMAKSFGVNTTLSGLQAKVGQVGLALGIGSLTVEEQATTFATLADDGEYYTPHVISQITLSNGSTVPLKVSHHQVLTPAQAADVDYALSFDNKPGGTAYPAAALNPYRPAIAKTGTTDIAESAFFIGAFPQQYSLAVGIFTNEQDSKTASQCPPGRGVNSNPPCGQTLNILPSLNGQGGGFGGTWPATIWNTYMSMVASNLPVNQLPTPNYVGFTQWDQVGHAAPAPPKKPHQNQGGGGQGDCPPDQKRFGVCPTPTATSTAAPSPTSSPSPLPTPSHHPPPPAGGP